MMTTVATLYERLGGEIGVERLILKLYERVLADPALAPFFRGAAMEKLQRMQREFLGAALGGPQVYGGLALSWVHAGRGIATEHFNHFGRHLLTALEDMSVAPEDVREVVHRISALKNDITGEAY
jgi:hemoglobin